MKNVTRFAAVLTLSLAVLGSSSGQPAQPASKFVTVITVPKMDCGTCARKIGTQIVTVPGVAQVAPNVETFQLVVTPLPNVGVSPRLLWEAVEKAGFAPSKMDTPYGVFVARPQN